MIFKITINQTPIAAVARPDLISLVLEFEAKPDDRVTVSAPSGCTAVVECWPRNILEQASEMRVIEARAQGYLDTKGQCNTIEG